MHPYRSNDGAHADEADEAISPTAAERTEALSVDAVVFVAGVLGIAASLAEPTWTAPGGIGLIMVAFAAWSAASPALGRRHEVPESARSRIR